MDKPGPKIGARRRPAELRFWEHVGETDANGCWPWMGARTGGGNGGYGQIRVPLGQDTVKWRRVPAHRFLFEIYYGPLPDGLELDHLCRNRRCVNPFHMEAVTGRVNILRGTAPSAINSRKTHCSKGHPLAGDNLKLERNKTGQVQRRCRTCAKIAAARYWRNLSAEERQRRIARQAIYDRERIRKKNEQRKQRPNGD